MAGWNYSDEVLGPTLVADQAPDGSKKAEGWSYADEKFGTPSAAPKPEPKVSDSKPEPDADTWFGRRWQDFAGKQDPKYKDLPVMSGEIARLGKSGMSEFGALLAGASDDDLANTYAKMLGPDYVGTEKDANGYPVMAYKDKDGTVKRAYVNPPGLDVGDFSRGVVGAVPFVLSGGAAGAALKGAGTVGRMLGMGATMGATSLAQDVAGHAGGVTKLDPTHSVTKAAIATGLGAAGEGVAAIIAPLWRRMITEPGLFDASKGKLTQAGEAAALEAGIDPAVLSSKLAEQFARAFAKTGDANQALRSMASNEFNIPRSLGELTGNRGQLLREQQMRGVTYGEPARAQIEAFDRQQERAIDNAVRGQMGSGDPGIAGKLAPHRMGSDLGKDTLGAQVRTNTTEAFNVAKQAEREAWDLVPRIEASKDARAMLPKVLDDTLSAARVIVDDVPNGITPNATRMGSMLEDFIEGTTPAKASSVMPRSSTGDIVTMQRRLRAFYDAAKDSGNSTDARAAGHIYDAYNKWIDVLAADTSPAAIQGAAALRAARGLTRQLHEVFDGPQGTAGGKILADILKKSDSAEGIVNALFTGPTAQIKNGTMTALQHLKRAYDTYLEPAAAKQAWDDVRLAYWLRVAATKTGETSKAAALSSALGQARGTQGSVMKMLYSDEERAMMRRFEMLLADAKRKNPNTSWSAIGVGQLARDAGQAILKTLGWNSALVGTALRTGAKPFTNTFGTIQASRATGAGSGAQPAPIPPPSWGPYFGAYGANRNEKKPK